jgi:hypothetical protein
MLAKSPSVLEPRGLFAIFRSPCYQRAGAPTRARPKSPSVLEPRGLFAIFRSPRYQRAGAPTRARWSWALGVGLVCLTLACERRSRTDQREEPLLTAPAASAKPKAKEATPALDVSLAYPTVEAIGAKKRIHWAKTTPSDAHSAPDAWKIEFEKSGGFAGVCWKNKLGNEGEAPGDDLSKARYRRISFWAKGAAGGEVAEFRAGGLGNVKTRYRESFDVSAGKIRLTPSWSEYTIYVMDADLSSVMTPFCVLFHREDNAEHTVIYVDDIQYGG